MAGEAEIEADAGASGSARTHSENPPPGSGSPPERGAVRWRPDLQTCCYLLLLMGLVGSFVWFQWFDGKSDRLARLFSTESASEYRLPEFAAERTGYAAETVGMLEALDKLEAREPEVNFAQRIMDWEERVTLADKLLVNQLTAADYHDILVSKLHSLINLTETRNLRSREMMLAAIEEYRGHPDDEVRKLALIGDVELGVIDCLKTPDASPAAAFERTALLLESFPNDEAVGRFLDSQVVLLVGRKKHDLAIELLRRMREVYKDASSISLTSLAAAIPDRILFIQTRLDEALERMQTNKEGADASLLNCLAQLASNPEAGPLVFRQVLEAALFYEQSNRFLHARDVYQLLEREMSRNRDPLIARNAEEAAQRGVARMESVGREVSIQGTLPDGTSIDSDDLRGKLVVLFFWRAQTQTESYQLALALNSVVRDYRNQGGVVFLGIGVDSATPAQAETTFGKIPNWHLQMAEHLASVEKLELALGIPKAPYVTVLDQAGKVSAINISPARLKSRLDELLSGSAGRGRPERR